ncbi:MAG: hypothetical protein ABI743_09265 [bacterium]
MRAFDVPPLAVLDLLDGGAPAPPSPFFVMSESAVQGLVAAWRAGLPNTKLLYAVKANRDGRLLQLLHDDRVEFALQSKADGDAVMRAGIPNGVCHLMRPEVLRYVAERGAVGSITTPNLASLSNTGAVLSLLRVRLLASSSAIRFAYRSGVPVSRLHAMLAAMKASGTVPDGLAFHQGSQIQDADEWQRLAAVLGEVGDVFPPNGVVNLGGGRPVAYGTGERDWRETLDHVCRLKQQGAFGDHPLWVEPGRALVAEAGWLVSTVLATSRTASTRVVELDVRIEDSLPERFYGIHHPVVWTTGQQGRIPTRLRGRDGVDLGLQTLPQNLKAGDRVVFGGAGAYTTALVPGRRCPPIVWSE